MLRSLIRCGKLYVSPPKLGTISTDRTSHIHSSFGCVTKQVQVTDDINDTPNYCEGAFSNRLKKKLFANYMEQTLNCSSKLAKTIWSKNPEFSEKTLNDIKKNVDVLTLKGVPNSVIVDNPSLLVLRNASLCSRLHLLESMNPKNIADFLPLALAPYEKLLEMKSVAVKEDRLTPDRHRIYHLSESLNMQPHTVSKYLSNKLHVLTKPFEQLDDRIKLLLKYKTTTNAKTVFVKTHSSDLVEYRLDVAKQLNLILSPSHIFTTRQARNLLFYKLTKRVRERNEILLGRSVAQYYADRLDCDIEKIKDILKLKPELDRTNLLMVDKKIDYLLNDSGFTGSDVLTYPSVMYMPLMKMKKRIPELQSYGCRRSCMLGIVYQSSVHYNAFLAILKRQWEKKHQALGQQIK